MGNLRGMHARLHVIPGGEFTTLVTQGFMVQLLAAKLGVATGQHLAEHCKCVLSLRADQG